MKKILFIDDRETYGGKATHITHAANELIKRGYEIHIATPNAKLFKNKVDCSISIEQYNFSDEMVKERFVSELNDMGFDIVNAHVYATFQILLLNIIHRNFKLIVTDHVGVYNAEEYEKFKEYFEETKKADAVVTVSLAGRRIFCKAGHKANKLHTIHNGIPKVNDITHVKSNKIVYSGRIEKDKGIFFLIEAMKEIHQMFPQIILDIFGDGSEKKKLEEIIRLEKLESFCRLKGFDNNISEKYKQYDILIMPSESESCSYSILEAMMSKCNILATAVDGNEEIIQHNTTGLLFEYGNINSLISQLDRLLGDENWSDILRENAFYAVNKYFSIEKAIDELERLF